MTEAQILNWSIAGGVGGAVLGLWLILYALHTFSFKRGEGPGDDG
ncbi:MAG: hypothetical protein AAFQ90_10580 [Pseudomonadota bacterium]